MNDKVCVLNLWITLLIEWVPVLVSEWIRWYVKLSGFMNRYDIN